MGERLSRGAEARSAAGEPHRRVAMSGVPETCAGLLRELRTSTWLPQYNVRGRAAPATPSLASPPPMAGTHARACPLAPRLLG